MRGKCLCGQVEFEVAEPLPKLYQCHCSLCRRQGGSASNSATIVPADKLRWVAGQERVSSWVKEKGFRSDFCSVCGSPVPNPLRQMPYYWVPAGLLEEGGGLEIAAHLCVDSKAAWEPAPASGQIYGDVPDLNEFLALLHADGQP